MYIAMYYFVCDCVPFNFKSVKIHNFLHLKKNEKDKDNYNKPA